MDKNKLNDRKRLVLEKLIRIGKTHIDSGKHVFTEAMKEFLFENGLCTPESSIMLANFLWIKCNEKQDIDIFDINVVLDMKTEEIKGFYPPSR